MIKTIAVCALALMANTAIAQNLKITSNGNPVSSGDVIELPYEFEDYSVPGKIEYYDFLWDPNLEASVAEGSASLTVTVTSLNDSEGFQLCWPGGCQTAEPGESVSSTSTIDTKPVNLMIHKEIIFNEAGKLPTEGGEATVSFECGSESFSITLKCLLTDSNAVGENFADIDAIPEYFTIQGVKIAEPQKGQLCIERKGSKVTKRIF